MTQNELVLYGGLTLRITRQGEARDIRNKIGEGGRFSAEFSRRDTQPAERELCLVAFDRDVLDSIWLGRLSTETVTGGVRIVFDQNVSLERLDLREAGTPEFLKDAIQKAFTERDNRLASDAWQNLLA